MNSNNHDTDKVIDEGSDNSNGHDDNGDNDIDNHDKQNNSNDL